MEKLPVCTSTSPARATFLASASAVSSACLSCDCTAPASAPSFVAAKVTTMTSMATSTLALLLRPRTPCSGGAPCATPLSGKARQSVATAANERRWRSNVMQRPVRIDSFRVVTAGQCCLESPANPRRIALVTNGEAMNTTANARPDRIVVVDDDARIRDLLRRYLTQEGFEVLLAEDAKALNRLLTRETVHLIVLDLMLPGEDGLSICRRLRAANDVTPIIMLTAKVEDVDRIVGLEVG